MQHMRNPGLLYCKGIYFFLRNYKQQQKSTHLCFFFHFHNLASRTKKNKKQKMNKSENLSHKVEKDKFKQLKKQSNVKNNLIKVLTLNQF